MIYFLTVNYYGSDLIKKLLDSLLQDSSITYQVIIVNNSPEDQEIEQLQAENIYILDPGENIGFARACNLGIQWIYEQNNQGIIWLINPDAYLSDNSIAEVLPLLQRHPQVAILGTIIYTPNKAIWFAGGRWLANTGTILPIDLLSTNADQEVVNCDWVSGCSFLLNLRCFPEPPLFDPAYFLYYEDVDFCLRHAKQGYVIGITSKIAVIHQPSSITDRNVTAKIQHSTYGYLYTLSRYTTKTIFWLRSLRLFFHALFLLIRQPSVAKGKFIGMWHYWQRFRQMSS